MDSSDKPFSELFGFVKSWIPWRSEPPGVSRDFWMPDQSCRVCYECDSQFTVFNRRHHCRLCGRVFCAKCTSNSVPVPSGLSGSVHEEWERIRVCNYCFKQWQQGVASFDNGIQVPSIDFINSPSVASFASSRSNSTINSSNFTIGPVPYSAGPYQRAERSPSGPSTQLTEEMEIGAGKQEERVSARSRVADVNYQYASHYAFAMNRSDDDDDGDGYSIYQSDSETVHFPQGNNSYHQFDNINNDGLHKSHLDGETADLKSLSSSPVNQSFGFQGLEEIGHVGEKDDRDMDGEGEVLTSMYPGADVDSEPVDFENNAVLWLPPEPEDEEDEKEEGLFDDDDDDDGNGAGEWGCLRSSSSFGSGEFRNRDKSTEEHKKVMKNVVDGHFRALVSQLLQVENVPIVDEDSQESWLEIITSLSWEAATLLKPDTSLGGGMDPGGYVKVKCVACGRRSDSMVVKGVVCKKNVAHRRMISKIEKPRLLILGGALEYQRVTNHLSSLDTLLQQEMDHLKMAVAKIDAHHPNILLVEKSVSRFAQDYLHAKDISLVLNIKRPLLERIARCSGAQIIPSIDHLSSPKLGYCEKFHVDKFLEDLGSAGQGGKKLTKTLMYFEGCPKPFGFTILLRGANGDELKKVKHVVQYGVFAAYHLALETSFLADEGASLPELPLNSPITVALPDKSSSIERSISTVLGFVVPGNEKFQGLLGESRRSNSVPSTCLTSAISSVDNFGIEQMNPGSRSQSLESSSCNNAAVFLSDICSKQTLLSYPNFSGDDRRGSEGFTDPGTLLTQNGSASISDKFTGDNSGNMDDFAAICFGADTVLESSQRDGNSNNDEAAPLKEEFPPSPSDHQSILVSLSSRCVWKGTVCERSHLFRIKYYGSFDKPLGRFLRDHLFDLSYMCRSCEMPSEAHVHCYTHRQGTLTISVKKLPEILLPGEKDGKIWMWHRCLKCPRTNNFPPSTRRVVMSDAAWGLSFGKFLELSFSNHAAASRVASCGHSLHRDCLRFYGFGKMVACFRYASINVLSVYVPPSKLDFNYNKQDWIQKETREMAERAKLLFSVVLNALRQIAEKRPGGSPVKNGLKVPESRRQISELELLLQKEKAEFEESLQKILDREVKKGQPVIDILDINRLQRQLIFQSYIWDRRLIYVAKLICIGSPYSSNDLPTGNEEKVIANSDKLSETYVTDVASRDLSNCDSLPLDGKQLNGDEHGGFVAATSQPDSVDEDMDMGLESNHERDTQSFLSDSLSTFDQSNQLESIETALSNSFVGQIPMMPNLSETLDAAWTGKMHPVTATSKDGAMFRMDSAVLDSSNAASVMESLDSERPLESQSGAKLNNFPASESSIRGMDSMEYPVSWLKMPFLSFYQSFNKNFFATSEKLDTLGEYNPVYISSFRELEVNSGARLLLPLGINDTAIPVFDDEPTSIISYALISSEYHGQLLDDGERVNGDLASYSSEPLFSPSMQAFEDVISETHRSLGSADESFLTMSASRSSLILDPLSYTKTLHARVSFGDDGPLGKVRYSVTCYFAKRFDALRKMCCPSELDYIRSLSRCKKWGAQGGKSNAFFAKTLDDRFIIKQVTKTELESFIKFAPEYFKYLSESIGSRSPTCLAKILGIYQVTVKHLKGGKESKMDLLVMENLLFERNVTRLYDLKGSSRSRYNPDSSGSNKVLLDQNLIEAMPTSPIFVGNKAKRLLERAVWNDTSFLASIDVMDYSLLVGVDEDSHELVLGIIDFMRQYTWDKHLETWVKASGILGGPKNASPTVISPKQYKKRFRKAMTTYFLMVPDQWSPPSIIPSSNSQSELNKENTQEGGNPVE